jgi:hypothetical protein
MARISCLVREVAVKQQRKIIDTLTEITEIESLCRRQLILTARLARSGGDIGSSEDLLSDLKAHLRYLRSARAEMRRLSDRRHDGAS